jgi:hypothetical protein
MATYMQDDDSGLKLQLRLAEEERDKAWRIMKETRGLSGFRASPMGHCCSNCHYMHHTRESRRFRRDICPALVGFVFPPCLVWLGLKDSSFIPRRKTTLPTSINPT